MDFEVRILDMRPTNMAATAGKFDAELGPHLRLYNLHLKLATTGDMRTYAPNADGKHVASFHPELASKITQAAVEALSRRRAAHVGR